MIAGWGEKERVQAARARAEVARRHDLDPERDFAEVERRRREEEAALEAAQEAAEAAWAAD